MTGTSAIRLLLADVDGTLVTPDKELTDRAIDAVHRLDDAGILFAITSGRPPRGMSMLIEPLDITTPIAAFNGGMLVNRDMSVVEQRVLPEELVVPVADLIGSFGLDTWVYRGADWYVRIRTAPTWPGNRRRCGSSRRSWRASTGSPATSRNWSA